MKPTQYTVHINVEVTDLERLYNAAVDAMPDDASRFDVVRTLGALDGIVNVEECIRLVVDPGSSPPGLQILDSQVTHGKD